MGHRVIPVCLSQTALGQLTSTPRHSQPTVRATLLSFFGIVYAAALLSHAVFVGISANTWVGAGVLIPFAALGAIAGRPLGDRLGVQAFAVLAIVLLATAGLYTLAASAGPATRQ